MYTLYYSPGSASMLVHLLLLEIGAPHELRRVDLDAGAQRDPAYLRLNPGGVVPTLIVDGAPRWETAALALLLAERHPEANLAPPPGSPARADYLQWMLYLANSLQPAFRWWFYPEAEGVAAEAVLAAARRRIEAAWDRLDAHLGAAGPYLLGAEVGAPDLYATMLMRWSRKMPRPATEWPHLAALAGRVKARPSWRRLYTIEGLTEWA
ncbi:glutathione S-transferase [Nannocystis exedens]|uniref:Glutathione S-transferase n=1 Tax=Nannocystis exedens TaxID=54 RepID=A0A1I2GZQ3_9BACT|nr:glutathione S-transferase family protein [Nannocystis exedens]PCC68859.1 glutathione S-transferase [Nannocystis exedens]SFF22630.1 glutathione S-transferase [Nannocystis exedens]